MLQLSRRTIIFALFLQETRLRAGLFVSSTMHLRLQNHGGCQGLVTMAMASPYEKNR